MFGIFICSSTDFVNIMSSLTHPNATLRLEKYLGYIINQNGIFSDLEVCISEMPTPLVFVHRLHSPFFLHCGFHYRSLRKVIADDLICQSVFDFLKDVHKCFKYCYWNLFGAASFFLWCCFFLWHKLSQI